VTKKRVSDPSTIQSAVSDSNQMAEPSASSGQPAPAAVKAEKAANTIPEKPPKSDRGRTLSESDPKPQLEVRIKVDFGEYRVQGCQMESFHTKIRIQVYFGGPWNGNV
jgi:hypothetical protein